MRNDTVQVCREFPLSLRFPMPTVTVAPKGPQPAIGHCKQFAYPGMFWNFIKGIMPGSFHWVQHGKSFAGPLGSHSEEAPCFLSFPLLVRLRLFPVVGRTIVLARLWTRKCYCQLHKSSGMDLLRTMESTCVIF